MTYDFLIVGAGPAGCVLAERLACESGQKVLLVDRRGHIGGNAYDFANEEGIFVQQYGPHIFHTAMENVWDYLSRFTEWNGYVHRVLAQVNDKAVYLPINLDTMEQLCGRSFTCDQLKEYFEQRKVPIERIENARDVVVSQVGEELYELFFKNYTKKQWGLYPEQLAAEVTQRLPVRYDRDTRYFADLYQGLPQEGFAALFERMVSHPNITIRLETEYPRDTALDTYRKLIYTGPIDTFFDYSLGRLPYRSLVFKFETLDTEWFQQAGVVNYPNDEDHTRITEFKHLYLQRHAKTTVCYEYGAAEGPPYYPIPTPANRALYQAYKAQADTLEDVHFLGRLAQYEYLNLDQVVGRALELYDRIRTRD
jgi:UDP-galactopyranose mutase